jgi:ATP-dependent protease ClpP protease subunit
MYHNGQWAIEGQQDNVKNTQKFFDTIDKEIKELFKKHTGLDDKTLKKRGVIDWFMDTDEALQNHIIDRVITSFDEIM